MDNKINKTLKYNLASPFQIHFELTTTCQASCPNCARNIGGVDLPWLEDKELSLEHVKKILEGTEIIKQSDILYCGTHGDPVAAKDIIPIVKWIQSQPYNKKEFTPNRTQIIHTNGGIRDNEFWTELGEIFDKKSNRGHVVFSIDGLEDTNHIYRKGVSWERLWDNLCTYVNAGGNAYWEFLVFGHNKHQVDKAEKLARSLGITFIKKSPTGFKMGSHGSYMHTYDKSGEYEYSISKLGDIRVLNITDRPGINLTKHDGKNLILSKDDIERSKRSTIRCKSLGRGKDRKFFRQDVYIKSDGHLLPCCHMDVVTSANPYSYGCKQIKDTIDNVYSMLDVVNNDIDELVVSNKFKQTFFDPMIMDSAENKKPMFCVDTCGGNTRTDLIYDTYQDNASKTANQLSEILGF